MRTLIVLVFSCALAIPSLSQDVQIKSGDFVMNCRATDNVKSNPEFLALYQTIIEGLKTAVENNQVPLNKNIDVRGDILKSSSSGKIFNGVMVLVGTSGAEMSSLRGTFFPCK